MSLRPPKRSLAGPFLMATLAIAALGLTVLYSATRARAGGGVSPLFMKQVVYMGLGAALAFAVSRVDPRRMEELTPFVWLGVMVLLVATLVVGDVRMGARRWIGFGPANLQPSELGKLALVMGLARWFHRHPRPDGYGLINLLPSAFLVAVPMGLVFFQPDLGTTLFYGFLTGSVVVFGGLRLRSIVLVVGLVLVSVPLAYNNILDQYQRDRIQTFLQPENDPRGKGYQTLQARYAVGAGRLTGKGYLSGTQSQGGFLPEQHTDFIFAVLGEEFGFLGSSALVALYTYWLLLGLGIAARVRERYAAVLAVGVTSILFWQMVINLGGVLGYMPVTGLTLPLLSYGGSSLLLMGLCVGVLLSIARSSAKPQH